MMLNACGAIEEMIYNIVSVAAIRATAQLIYLFGRTCCVASLRAGSVGCNSYNM